MQAKAAIYLDSNASAPLHPRVTRALLSFLGDASSLQANPSSLHSFGKKSRRLLENARDAVARSIDADSNQIVFTSSGTESNQTVIRAVFEPLFLLGRRPHWITTPIEHDSVLQMVDWLKARGGSVSYLPVSSSGQLDIEAVKKHRTPETALLSAIWVNNETGTITDVSRLSAVAQAAKLPLHLDAAQAWGKVPVSLRELGADWVTFSGHKIGALPGTGVLWARSSSNLSAQNSFLLGSQEKSRRGGTESLMGAIALGAAATELNPQAWTLKLSKVRDELESKILNQIPGSFVNGGGVRVANTLNVGFEGASNQRLLQDLDLSGFAVSAGSACSSGLNQPSHVLIALGRSEAQALSSIRISLGEDLLEGEWLEEFLAALSRSVGKMRQC